MSHCALDAGADFIKTSTGKTPVSATIEAAEEMLAAIRRHGAGGFKASGGIRDTATAMAYLRLAELMLGESWIDAGHFRFGASGLLDGLLHTLADAPRPVAPNGY